QCIYDLIQEAKNGNKQSFFKAIRADRSLIYADWAKKAILKAHLSKDEEFMINLSVALQNPLSIASSRRKRIAEIIFVLLLWEHFLKHFTNEQNLEFLNEL